MIFFLGTCFFAQSYKYKNNLEHGQETYTRFASSIF